MRRVLAASLSSREQGRLRRHRRVRSRVHGVAERPRLVVHRSHLNLLAQIVDDLSGKTLMTCTTLQDGLKGKTRNRGNVEAAKRLGERVAEQALSAGICKVVFDRGGYSYHGRVKALAEAARAKGLDF